MPARAESRLVHCSSGAPGFAGLDVDLCSVSSVKANTVQCSRVIVLIATNDNVQSLRQWSKLRRNTLPSIPAHHNRIDAALRRVRGNASEVSHFLREAPWKACVVTDTIRESCGNYDCKSRHGVKMKLVSCNSVGDLVGGRVQSSDEL